MKNTFARWPSGLSARLLGLLACLLILGACARHEESSPMPPTGRMRSADKVAAAAAEPAAAQATANETMAYEHSLSMDVAENRVAPLFEAAQAACRETAPSACTILEARIDSGRNASANLKFRAKKDGIRKIIDSLSSQGEVTAQSTQAEDLAVPIADTTKKLAMLKDYRSRLENLRSRAQKVDDLITLNRELADVQSQLESSEGEYAFLRQRVDSEILNISIQSRQQRSVWKPISLAFGDFGGNLAQGASSSITALAYLLPWIPLLLAMIWLVRKLWRWRKRNS